ncbi:hypothetical protein QBC41DRAFT_299467 [Cercophora samala]|uniref:Uncharacterized protein n=1 Tax=Cercophora samala TaxID=330535 RepID=A0AA39ZK81_9PEZI|nr:hypothetical protein QBC41DRAFT_299467 [Cercophora samala]
MPASPASQAIDSTRELLIQFCRQLREFINSGGRLSTLDRGPPDPPGTTPTQSLEAILTRVEGGLVELLQLLVQVRGDEEAEVAIMGATKPNEKPEWRLYFTLRCLNGHPRLRVHPERPLLVQEQPRPERHTIFAHDKKNQRYRRFLEQQRQGRATSSTPSPRTPNGDLVFMYNRSVPDCVINCVLEDEAEKTDQFKWIWPMWSIKGIPGTVMRSPEWPASRPLKPEPGRNMETMFFELEKMSAM